jgi:hypothetical protein
MSDELDIPSPELQTKVIKDARDRVVFEAMSERTFIIVLICHVDSNRNSLTRIHCKKGIPIAGYVYDTVTESYHVECHAYLQLGYVPISLQQTMPGVGNWCLSGGAWIYVRSQKGDSPMMMRDLARLDPRTVQLWNGEKWTQLLGVNLLKRTGHELEIVLRSGERISCTPNHKFPTSEGLLEAKEIIAGNCLCACRLPESKESIRAEHIGPDAAWLAGLYLAEGWGVERGKIYLAGHSKEYYRWIRVQHIVKSYGGKCTLTTNGNNQTIKIYGKVICAIISELVSGHNAKNKGIAPVVWRYDDDFLRSFMSGYLGGDGHEDKPNRRWRLGFTRNYNLERDIRTVCARLGWALTLNSWCNKFDGKKFPAFRGEIRELRSGYQSEKDRCEVMDVRKARCREVYDISVADEPHVFALSSGVLTHNSQRIPLPENALRRFFTPQQKRDLKNLKTTYKSPQFTFQYMQIIDCY